MNSSCLRTPAPFIVGVARSGTTLLRLLLDAHPEIAIPPETHFAAQFVAAHRWQGGPEEFAKSLAAAQTWPNMGIDAEAFREIIMNIRSFTVSDGLRAFYTTYAARFGKKRWGDKTPPYRNSLAGLAELLPEARFIHLVRDGRDVALSYRGLWFGPGDDVERQASFWVDEVNSTRMQGRSLPHYLEVRYEQLIYAPEATLARICEFISASFDPSMLGYYRNARHRMAEIKASYGPPGTDPPDLERCLAIHDIVTRPFDPSRCGRWRNEMSEDDQRRFEAIAGPLLASEGYETRFYDR